MDIDIAAEIVYPAQHLRPKYDQRWGIKPDDWDNLMKALKETAPEAVEIVESFATQYL